MEPDLYREIHACLHSGLPLPAHLETPLVARGSRVALEEFVASLGVSRWRQPVMIVDEEDRELAMITKSSPVQAASYVVDPRSLHRPASTRPLKSWAPDEFGVPRGVRGPQQSLAPLLAVPKNTTSVASRADVRLVTADASVHASGLRAELFEADDRLVVSMASQLDIMAASFTSLNKEGVEEYSSQPGWHVQNALVPINFRVLIDFAALVLNWKAGTPEQRGALTMGDVLCAATSAAYNLPLYTTRPAAYRFLKHQLKTVKYGPVRNPGIVDHSDGTSSTTVAEDAIETRARDQLVPPQIVIADPAICSGLVRTRYQAGADLADQDRQMIANVTADITEYQRLVHAIVGDQRGDDLTWTTAVLSHATEVASQIRASANRSELVFAVRGVFPSAQDLDTPAKRDAYDAALNALAEWGEWSDDFLEMLNDLEETDAPLSAAWYLTLLRLKGIDRDTVARERRAIAEGLKVGVTERFHEVVSAFESS